MYKKISKPFRFVTDEATPSLPNFLPYFAFGNRHRLYCVNNSETPCYTEFMNLVECMKDKKNEMTVKCWPQYEKLIKCLRFHGVDSR